jgi:transposase
MFLYVITNLVNAKRYVGITRDPGRRRRQHFSDHGSVLVSSAIRKYGRDNLDMEVWYEGDEEWMKLMEQRTILALGTLAPTGYNLKHGGDGSGPEASEKIARRRMKPLTLSGITFVSMHEAVQHFNTSYATIRKHLQRGDKEFLAFDRAEAGRKLAKSAKGRKRTDAQRQHMRDTRGGAQHPCAKRVVVNGKEYGCLKDAAKDQGVNYSTLRWRFQGFERSGLWPDGFAVFTN